MEPLALKKYINLCEYLALYPEFQCIFIGDNGQGDVRTGTYLYSLFDENVFIKKHYFIAEMMLDTPNFSGNMERVYVHLVQPLHLTYVTHPTTKKSTHPSICYFHTYIDAALDAFQHKLIRWVNDC